MDTPSAKPPATARPHLGDRINIATRPAHARLNKSILERLPRALPPYAANPSIYASGLLHIAPIYLVFESLWHNFVRDGDDAPTSSPFLDSAELLHFPSSESHTPPPASLPDCPPHVRTALTNLYLPTLLRSPFLHADLRAITGWSQAEVSTQLRLAAASGRLAHFLAHTKRSVSHNPHVLLAYAWVLYMALFSGGRFLRATLEEAPPAFWKAKADSVAPCGCTCYQPAGGKLPLSFFRFATPEDGEDLKREFKRRLVEVEETLSDQEMAEVVQEAICVFDNMVLLVGQLDGVCGGDASSGDTSPRPVDEGWLAALLPKFLGGRTRDSVAVAKERGVKELPKKVWKRAHKAGNRARGLDGTGNEEQLAEEVKLTEPAEEIATTDDIEVSHEKSVHFGVDTKGGMEDEIGAFDGSLRFASCPSVRNAAVLVGLLGVVWALGRLSK